MSERTSAEKDAGDGCQKRPCVCETVVLPTAEKDVPAGYVRDRSFYPSRPSGAYAPKIHRESVTRPGMAACDTAYGLLDTDRPIALVDDAAQKARWCLRCFPVGQHYDFPPDGAPFYCYPCARGDHGEHKPVAWVPDVPCECPECVIPPGSAAP